MTNRLHTLAAALSLSLATLGQAGATETGFSIPAVIGAAYHDRNVATTPVEVRRQGGFAMPAAAQWLPATPALTTSVETMWFADAYATAYYTLDQQNHQLVVRFEPGPQGGNAVVVRRTLGEGAVERISVDGTDDNKLRATLTVSREAGALNAQVSTELLPQQQASN